MSQRQAEAEAELRRHTIETLLVWMRDVEEGVQTGNGAGEGSLPLMCRAWNHPSYRELRRLLQRMRVERRNLYWALMERYVRCEVRNADVVMRRGRWLISDHEQVLGADGHGKGAAKDDKRLPTSGVYRKVVVKWSQHVRPEDVKAALVWLDENWQGLLFVPDDLLAVKLAA